MSSSFESNSLENVNMEILLEDTLHPNTIMTNNYGKKIEYQTFYGSEPIKGSLKLILSNNQKINHSGIKIELIGQIDIHINENGEENTNINNSGNQFNRFLSLSNYICKQGTLSKELNIFNFEFKSVEKQYDTYRGKKFSIKYLLLVTMNIGLNNITKEKEICIFNCDKNYQNLKKIFQDEKNIRVEIGIENLLHVYFELDKKNYHLKDVITGKVCFKKINLEIENMSLKIVKIESLFGKEGEIDPLGVLEIMDGSPSSTEDIIYFKMYLKAYNNLSQTISNEMNNNINVSYYISLEICDNENRNFFKKIGINLFRLPEEYYNNRRQKLLEGGKDEFNIQNDDNFEKNYKKNQIKNIFNNVKNPLDEEFQKKIENNDKEEDEEELNKIQNKKKISSLFSSDFD